MAQLGSGLADRILTPVVILLLAVTAGAAQLLVPELRAVPTLLFLVVGPGAALLNLTRLPRDAMFVLGSVAASVVLASLVGQLLLALNGAFGAALPLGTGFWLLLAVSVLASLSACTNTSQRRVRVPDVT